MTAVRMEAADVLDRLRKIEGQVRGIQHMVERGERCTGVLIHVAAARPALASVGIGLVDAHVRAVVTAGAIDDADGLTDDAVAAVHLLVR